MEPPRARPPRPRWVAAAVAAFVAFEVGAGAALLARSRRSEPPPPPVPAAASPSAAPATARPSAGDADAARARAVAATLDRRARAIRTRDRAAFAATLDSRATAFAERQLRMFDALRDVPLASWRYDLHAGDIARPPAKYDGTAWAPRVTLRYRLAGFDAVPTASDAFFTFVRRGGGWLVAADDDFADDGRRTAREMWDLGPVAVVRGERSLVIGQPGRHSFLRDVARQADEAVPRVRAVWTGRWSERVVVLVPGTAAEIKALLGDVGDLSRVAAVAVAELPGGDGDRPVGNRVIVNSPNFRRLGTLGRRVVLTHEVTHVATRDASAAGVPAWLVEGFADYVGYQGTGLSARAVCQELRESVRAGRAPRELPADRDFDGANPKLAQAYESAWLAVRLIAERAGERGLVALYQRAAAEPLPAVLRDVTGLTVPEFTTEWRAYVRRTLA